MCWKRHSLAPQLYNRWDNPVQVAIALQGQVVYDRVFPKPLYRFVPTKIRYPPRSLVQDTWKVTARYCVQLADT